MGWPIRYHRNAWSDRHRDRIKNAREQMGQIQKQLGEFHELPQRFSATKSLEDILGGAKSRGMLGEVTLERLLEDCLPPSQFSSQHRFSSGEIADAVIFLRDSKLMSIDSKFPLDAFRRISTDGDDARKQFVTAVKGHVDAIARKYIVPGEGTLDMALMFVPSGAFITNCSCWLTAKASNWTVIAAARR
jgi:DNA recombination protein RmuC